MEEPEKNELVLAVEAIEVDQTYKENALQAYSPFMKRLEDISIQANTINFESPDQVDSDLARKLRLTLVKVRTDSEAEKKKRKELVLLVGKLEDHSNGVVVTASKLMEARLEEVEKHAERKAQEERERLKEKRMTLLSTFGVDLTYIPLDKISDEDFNKLLADSEILHNAKESEAKKKEEERIKQEEKEAKEREEQRLENERLKAAAEIRKNREFMLRHYIVFIRDYDGLIEKPEEDFQKDFSDIKKGAEDHWKFETEQKEKREKEEAKQKAQEEKQRKSDDLERKKRETLQNTRFESLKPYIECIREGVRVLELYKLTDKEFEGELEDAKQLSIARAKKLADEQRQRQEEKKRNDDLEKENKRLQEEQKNKEEEDRKKAEQENEAQRKAALAPDREKLLKMNEQLDALVFPHNVESDKAKIAVNDTIAMVEKLKAFIIKRSEEL